METMSSVSEELAQKALDKSNLVIVAGAQWWDEGKWKAVSAFQRKDIFLIVGANGGGNAGHTVHYHGEKLDFHELPGGSVIEWAQIYLSKWKVINVATLVSELYKLRGAWIDLKGKLIIGWWAQVILKSAQQALDQHIEALKWKSAVGTTMKGIGPAYALGDLRVGITIKELVMKDDDYLHNRIKTIVGIFPSLQEENMLRELVTERSKLRELMESWVLSIDTEDMLVNDRYRDGRNILVEQSQSFLLGREGGAYPNCTSSDTSIAGLLSYLNLPYNANPEVIATIKAVMSKVGGGILATQMGRESNQYLAFEQAFADMTDEKWVTTGRLRDLGWVDMVALRHVLRINPIHTLLITKGDILKILAREQQKAKLPLEMRFYHSFQSPDGHTVPSGVITDPDYIWQHSSIALSPDDTSSNIRAFGDRIWELLPEFSWPIYFGTGAGERDVVKFR